MKYKRCEDCPEHIEDFIKEYDDGWVEITPRRYCKLVMEDDKPKALRDPRGLPPPPDWCPYKQVEGEKA